MPQSRNTVRFAEQQNETILFCTSAYSKSLWYNREDFKTWKRADRRAARTWRHQGYGRLLDDTFETPSSDVQKRITAFARMSDEKCPRGMERHLNQKHDEERTFLKNRAIDGFLQCQRVFLMESRAHGTPEQSRECRSRLLQDYSREARRFAERVGAADAICAREGEDPREGEELLKLPPKPERWSSSGSIYDAVKAPQQPRQPERSGDISCEECPMSLLKAALAA